MRPRVRAEGTAEAPLRQGWLPHRIPVCVAGRTVKRRAHRLVALHYLPNPERHPEVNHKDEDKANSWDWNLEWMSVADNRNHGTRNERIKKSLTAKSR